MAARNVDAYLTGFGGTQLPISGGISKRLPYEVLVKMNNSRPVEEVAA